MKRILKIFSILVFITIMTGLFYGCGNKEKKKLKTDDGTANLVYYIWGNDNEIKTAQTIVKNFMAANPKIKIEIERAGGDYYGMLRTRFAGNNEPDIFLMDSGEITPFLKEGLLLNLENYIKKSDKLKESDLWSVNDSYRYNGEKLGSGDLYALVKDWTPDFMMIYNKNQFKEAGIPFPSETDPMSWDEFLNISKKLTIRNSDGTVKRYGTSMDFVPYKHIFEYVAMTGGRMFTDDNKKFNYTDPKVKQAFQYFVNLQKGPDAPAEYTSGSSASVSGERFTSGDVSIVWYGRWAYSAYNWDKVNFEVGIAPPPVPEKGMKPYSATSGMIANAVSANTQYPDAAWRFVEYYETEGMKEVSKEGFNIPGNKTIATTLFKNEGNEKTKKVNNFFLNAAENYTHPVEYNPYISQTRFETILGKEISLVFEGKQDLNTALEKSAKDIDAAIASSIN